ncbi:MAG: N-acetylneuraminate synthase family protein [Candidatus Harrisonbacteria bacterium]|nr:N-acetylneuraminate synthase family protein [Candidatus Harrisonbacteria bacterium]
MTASEKIWEKIEKGVFIIAEAGKNFIQTADDRLVEEYLKNAKELVDRAVWAGADAIKFQTHSVEDEQLNIEIVSPHFKGLDRYQWVRRNTLATPVNEFWRPLKDYCEQKGIVFFSTPMSRGAAMRLSEVGVPLWKIGSGDILDFVCMDYLRATDIPVIMSSGMSTLEEVRKGIDFLRAKNPRVALMHALSKYPGLPEEANLAVMQLFQESFPGVPIGFSENSVGIEPSLLAVALGATIIEKHFTLRRDLWGSDHKVSSTPEEFKELVAAIRKIENSSEEKDRWINYPNLSAVLGKKEKILQKDEAEFRPIFRKSLMAGMDLTAGTVLEPKMLYAMRPQKYAGGLPSEDYEEVLGKRIKIPLKKFDPITKMVLE